MTKQPLLGQSEGPAALDPDSADVSALYDAFADRVHDFCWSLLRDDRQAADATERTFLRSVDWLEQVTDMQPPRAWLYAVAYRQVREVARGNDVVVEGPDPFAEDLAVSGADGQEVEREVVWRAAADLTERDQALLTLHLRHGLDEAELSPALDVDGEHARVLVRRLPGQAGRSLGAMLVGRRRRRDCPELARLVTESELRASLVRKRVTRHVDRCRTCAGHRDGSEALALLATVPVLTAPPELRERVLGGIAVEAEGRRPADPPAGGGKGVWRLRRPRAPRPRWRLAGAVVAALALVAAGVAVFSQVQRPGGTPVTGAPKALGATPTPTGSANGPAASATLPGSSSSTTTQTTAAPTSTTTAAPPAARLAVSPEVVNFSARQRTATLTIRNAGAGTVDWAASTSAGWLTAAPAGGSLDPGSSAQVTLTVDRDGLPEGQVRATTTIAAGAARRQVGVTVAVERAPTVSASASPTRIRTLSLCGDTTATVTATVSDESALRSVVLEWGDPVNQAAMTQQSGGSWRGTVGPVGSAQTIDWRVVATDADGNTATAGGTVQADGCLVGG